MAQYAIRSIVLQDDPLPPPSADNEGQIVILINQGVNIRDRIYICLKSESGVFTWSEIASGGGQIRHYSKITHASKLTKELHDAGLTKGSRILDVISSSTGTIIQIANDLTATEITTMDNIVNAHTLPPTFTYSWTGPESSGSATVSTHSEVDNVTANRIRNIIANGATFDEQLQQQLKFLRLAIAQVDTILSREFRTQAERDTAKALLNQLRGYNNTIETIRKQGADFKAANPTLFNDIISTPTVSPVIVPEYIQESFSDLTSQVDGVKTVFTINPYVSNTLKIYYKGLRMRLNSDYTESNPATGQFTMNYAPSVGGSLVVFYIKS